jgi:hypothetical protein
VLAEHIEPGSPTSPDQPTPSVFAAVNDTVSGLFDVVGGMSRTTAMLDGMRAEAIAQAISWNGMIEPGAPTGSSMSRELRLRALRAELALVMRIPESTAEAMLAASEKLVHDLPQTLAVLKTGEISYRHAQAMVDQAVGLEADDCRQLERSALPFARTLTAVKFTRKLRQLREALNPESITERHRHAAEFREVRVEPGADGMAWLTAHLPAVHALGIVDRITGIAKTLHSKDEARTLTQLRADVFCDLLIDGAPTMGGASGIRPKVFVTVPVLTLLGVEETPASLDGYGPIDPDTARLLAGHAPSFTRLLTHPETGAILSVGRDSYAVPRDLKIWLQLRDGTCRFPGCSRAASRSDVDHSYDWDWGGDTRHDNLAHLCRGHHTLKHKTPWKVAQADGGVLTWTSPFGRDYVTEPEIRMRT